MPGFKVPSGGVSRVAATLCCALGTWLIGPGPALAFDESVPRVPNGNTLSCELCHPAGQPLTELNEMGVQTQQVSVDSREPNWAELALLDADCDGFSNGAELGDPEGDWVPPEVPDSLVSTDPNDPDDFPAVGTPEDICGLLEDAGPPDGGPVDDGGPPDGGPVGGDAFSAINNTTGNRVFGPVGCATSPPVLGLLVGLLWALFALRGRKGHNQRHR